MSAIKQAQAACVDDLLALPLLERLARIHPWIFVVDSHRHVVWASEGISELPGIGKIRPGEDARDFFAALPRPEQIFPLRSNLRGRSHLVGAPLELRGEDGRSICIDLDLLRVGTGAQEFLVAIASEHPNATGSALDAELANAGSDALLAVDPEGFVRWVNPAACRLLGAQESELLARPLSTLLVQRDEDVETLESLVALLRGPLRQAERELRWTAANGQVRTVQARVTPLASGLRALTLRDLGPGRSEVEELRHTNEELEHTLGALAHDLRSPLMGLLGFSRLLREDYAEVLDETGRHFLDRIESSAHTMERLLHDLLELARIGEAGEVPCLVDPHPLLRQLVLEFKPRLDALGVELALPDAKSTALYCDRSRLYQLFSNLIGNAVEHMGPCPQARIQVEVRETESEHEIVVADNGRGVDPRHRAQIFDGFASFGTRSGGERGTGMGLAIVKRIAEKYGGRAWLDEGPEAGARFHVTLPRPEGLGTS